MKNHRDEPLQRSQRRLLEVTALTSDKVTLSGQVADEGRDEGTSTCSVLLLPDEILLRILHLVAPAEDSAPRWTWLDRMRQVSRRFRDVCDEYLRPTELNLSFVARRYPLCPFEQEKKGFDSRLDAVILKHPVHLLQMLRRKRWMTERLEVLSMHISNPRWQRTPSWAVKEACQLLLSTTGAFERVNSVTICCTCYSSSSLSSSPPSVQFELMDTELFVQAFAKTFPEVKYLTLHGCFSPSLPSSVPWFSILSCFPKLMSLSLARIPRFSGEYFCRACRYMCPRLRELEVIGCGELVEDSLQDDDIVSLSEGCTSLLFLTLDDQLDLSEIGLKAILEANPKLNRLSVNMSDLTPSAGSLIGKYAPNLRYLSVQSDIWFNGDALMALAQSGLELEELHFDAEFVSPFHVKAALRVNPKLFRHLVTQYFDERSLREGDLSLAMLEDGLERLDVSDEIRPFITEDGPEVKEEWLNIIAEFGIRLTARMRPAIKELQRSVMYGF